MSMTLVGSVGAVLLVSFLLAAPVRTAEGFFRGFSEAGRPPGLLTLTFSQVTTWIFARSLMNAAILGYFYGIAGTVAYAAYYLSFLTGWAIVDSIRFRHGFDSVQAFLTDRFGRPGSAAYNLVVGLRLMSEVFANLLVIGIIFGVAGSTAYTWAIVAAAVLTLGYSMSGGLRASLRTDVLQTSVLLAMLLVLLAVVTGSGGFSWPAIAVSSPDMSGPGWVLLLVAGLQIWSYPLHDPVMMDRGFLADRDTTRRSFLHACWISVLCILAFGLLGVHAGLHRMEGEEMVATLTRLLGGEAMLVFNVALVISAVSTLDSTFSSAAKLAVVDMKLARPTAANGRVAMALFLLGGLGFLFFGPKDLFAAVAVSGTASMFLAPVVLFGIWGGRRVAPWAFGVAFVTALGGAALYFLESSGSVAFGLIEPLFGIEHKYSKLLLIAAVVLAVGCGAFALALEDDKETETA